jgi:hypothetical protein
MNESESEGSCLRGEGLPRPAAARGGLGPGRKSRNHPSDQSYGVRPATMAAIYKDRWEVELFFKALKQNLKV